MLDSWLQRALCWGERQGWDHPAASRLPLLSSPGTELLAGRGEALCSETELTGDEDCSCEKGAAREDRGHEGFSPDPCVPALLILAAELSSLHPGSLATRWYTGTSLPVSSPVPFWLQSGPPGKRPGRKTT